MTFYKYMKENYSQEELYEITVHGCVSGCASGLIYYCDTSELYEKHKEELHGVLDEWMKEIGETPEFITKELGFYIRFANAMVWFVAEQYASEIYQTMEVEDASN